MTLETKPTGFLLRLYYLVTGQVSNIILDYDKKTRDEMK